MRLKQLGIGILLLFVGILIGGFLFRDVQPRSFLAINSCGTMCWKPSDLVGLMTSIGVQKFSDVLPLVVMETDKSIVIQHPWPKSPVHYVLFPKRDIKNIGELAEGDQAYLIDAFAVLSELIRKEHLKNYKILTNGPGYQETTYLHFHLQAER